MTVVTKREYVPLPKGIYNLRIEDYEEREKQDKTGHFFSWKIAVLDSLPAEFTGRNVFNIITATDLTPGNNLNKFLARVGMEDVPVGESIDLDALKGHVFVGSVIVKKGKNDKMGNDLGDITVPEYNRWLASQGATIPQTVAPTPTPNSATLKKPTQVVQPNATPTVARPTTPVTTPRVGATPVAFRPNAMKPTPRVVTTQPQPESEVVNESVQDDSVDDFPS